MKRFLFFMAVLLTGGQAVAQEVEETKTLSEVTIHGARIVQRVDGQTIYPTQQQVAFYQWVFAFGKADIAKSSCRPNNAYHNSVVQRWQRTGKNQ